MSAELRAAERRLRAAQLASDIDALDELLDEHVRYVSPSGGVLTKGDDLPCDVLLSNLPTEHTERLLALLPALSVRTAVVTASEALEVGELVGYSVDNVAPIGGEDFAPTQPTVTKLVRVSRRRAV